MSRHRKIAVVAGVVLAALAASAWRYDRAQGAAESKVAGREVAFLDFGRVFREAKRLRAGIAALKTDAARADERFKRERQKLQAQRAEARRLPAESAERTRRESELDGLEAALGATIALQTKAIHKREADLYNQTYREAIAEVETYSKANGIEVVMRINSEPVDTGKLESILGHVNRAVVWSAPEADITSIIIERINQRETT
jgi:Skp family chaperone for outer membrane proteins